MSKQKQKAPPRSSSHVEQQGILAMNCRLEHTHVVKTNAHADKVIK